MVPAEFLRDLVDEIHSITEQITYYKADGTTVQGATCYQQQLPVITEDEDDVSAFFPYCIIRLLDGETQDDNDCWLVKTNILIGCYDEANDTNGHLDVLETIQRITDRFAKKPLLSKKYMAQQHVQWALQDEDTYPYYFGGIELSFYLPKIGREDDYA